MRGFSHAVPRRARREAVDEDRLAVSMPSQGAGCRARSETAKTTRDGVRVTRCAGRTGAKGRVLDRGCGRVSPAPLWWRRRGRSGAAEQEAEEARSYGYGIVRWNLGLGGEGVCPQSCLNLEPPRSGLNNFGQKITYFV